MGSSKSASMSMMPLLLAMGLVMIASIEVVRNSLGTGLNVILGPLVDSFHVPFFIVIVFLSALTGLYSSVIQKYTIDYRKMKETQNRMKDFQKDYREAMLSNDEKRIKKMEAKRDGMMKDQLEMSQAQFKPMGYIMVITLPIFFWLIFRLNNFDAMITMPFFGNVHLTDLILGPAPAWIIWYMLCSITLSQVIRKALDIGGI
ncbi:MAG TPA: EMC3/TMCO1 family protein [Methanospirillum sp.]|nr:EMC3/TMCO1 family protein [Methanospirillum sp.]